MPAQSQSLAQAPPLPTVPVLAQQVSVSSAQLPEAHSQG
jgi:hypothetical protein